MGTANRIIRNTRVIRVKPSIESSYLATSYHYVCDAVVAVGCSCSTPSCVCICWGKYRPNHLQNRCVIGPISSLCSHSPLTGADNSLYQQCHGARQRATVGS